MGWPSFNHSPKQHLKDGYCFNPGETGEQSLGAPVMLLGGDGSYHSGTCTHQLLTLQALASEG